MILRVILVAAALTYAATGKLNAQEMNKGLSFLKLKIDPQFNLNTNAFSVASSMYSESGNDELAKAKSDFKAKKLYFKMVKASNRASADFGKSFRKITDPEWQVQKDAIVATFIDNEIKTFVVYDKAGRWVRNMSYLFPNRIPELLMKDISRQYPEYTINMALEITEYNAKYHIMYLESQNFIKHVCVYGNQVEETLEFKKIK